MEPDRKLLEQGGAQKGRQGRVAWYHLSHEYVMGARTSPKQAACCEEPFGSRLQVPSAISTLNKYLGAFSGPLSTPPSDTAAHYARQSLPTDPIGIFKVSPVLPQSLCYALSPVRVLQLLRASRPPGHVWTNEDLCSVGLPPLVIDAETWRAHLARNGGGGAIEATAAEKPDDSDAEQAGASQVKVASGGPSPSDGQHLEVSSSCVPRSGSAFPEASEE